MSAARSKLALVAAVVMAGVVLGACGGSGSGVSIPGIDAPSSTPGVVSTPTGSVAPTTAAPVSGTIQVGPGPQASYTVQVQPVAGSCHYTYIGADPLPDPRCTPGAINPAVTQANLSSTICMKGYTAGVRPPESITHAEKVGSAAAYGYTGSFSTGEYDHLISLELGGDPNAAANLWVEPNDNPAATTTANGKDILENKLNKLVCSGQISLATAQSAIATNWVAAAQRYGG